MADKKKNAPRFMAPRGVFVFPKLNAADTKFKAEGEFAVKVRVDSERPDVQAFIAKLTPFHDAAVEAGRVAFQALPVKARKDFEKKGVKDAVVNPLFSEVYDEETEQPTGAVEFKFSTPASGTIKNGKYAGKVFIKRPTLVDAKGKVLVQGTDFSFLSDVKQGTLQNTVLRKMGPAIWGGSEGICAIEIGLNKDGEPGYFIPGTAACGLSLRLRGVQLLKLVQGGSADMGFGQEEGYEADDGDEHDSEDADSTDNAGTDDTSDDATSGSEF
jgi:hypothetical protein